MRVKFSLWILVGLSLIGLGFRLPPRLALVPPDVVVVQGSTEVVNQVKLLLVPRIAERADVVVVPSETIPSARLADDMAATPLLVYVADPSHARIPGWIETAIAQNGSAGVLAIGTSSASFGDPGVSIASGVDTLRILHVAEAAWPLTARVSGLVQHPAAGGVYPAWTTSATVTTDRGAIVPYLMATRRPSGRPLVIAGSWSTAPLLLATIFRGLNEAIGLHSHASARILWLIGPITPTTNLVDLQRVVAWFDQRHQSFVLAVNPVPENHLAALSPVLHRLERTGAELVLAPGPGDLGPPRASSQIVSHDFLALIRQHLYPVALVPPPRLREGGRVRFSLIFGTIDGTVLSESVKVQGATVLPAPLTLGSAAPQVASGLMATITARQIAGAAVVTVDVPTFVALSSLSQVIAASTWLRMAPYSIARLASVVRSPWVLIEHQSGRTTVHILDPSIDRGRIKPITMAEQITRFLSWAITLAISGVVIQFFRQIRRLRKTRGHRLFHERIDPRGDDQ